jgi:hypothetical protein
MLFCDPHMVIEDCALESAAERPDGARGRGEPSLSRTASPELETAMLGTVLLVILILMLLGAIPTWPYSATWGNGPSGIIGVLLVIVIVLMFTGRL